MFRFSKTCRRSVGIAKRRVAVIFTGGTIESVGRDRLDTAWYMDNQVRLSNSEVLARLPELAGLADVVEVPFRKLPSHALVHEDWLELAATLQSLFDEDKVDGIVVTHGTNTLEETAYFLHLALKTDRPVVMVGAMRPSSAISPDGDLNLFKAVAVAASPDAAGKGVLVTLNDSIISARDATKTSTYRVQSFQGREVGPLGFADNDGRIVWYHQPIKPHTVSTQFDITSATELPRVDVVVSYVGADGFMIDAAVSAGAKGLVSAGTGAGRPTPLEQAALERAHSAGVLICIASRVGSGRVVRSPAFKQKGYVAADNLQPWKARVLLVLALTVTRDSDDIQRMFDIY